MSAILWTLLAAGALMVVLGIVLAWKLKKQKRRQEPDYRNFFWMGLIWVIVFGAYSVIRMEFTMSGLLAMGVIFLVMGAANRDKWKDSKPLTQNQRMVWYAVAIGLIALVVGMYFFLPCC